MSRHWIATDLIARTRTLCQNARLLADDATDAGLLSDADHVNLATDQVLVACEEADAADAPVKRARQEATVARQKVKRADDRLCLEIERQLSREDSALLLTHARLRAEPTARHRLGALAPEQRAALGAVVDEAAAAVDAHDDAERRVFRAAARQAWSKTRLLGLAWALRADLERVKAKLLVVLPPDGDPYRRVSRLVVRTRRPDAWFAERLR